MQDYGALSPLERRFSDDSLDEQSPLLEKHVFARERYRLINWGSAATSNTLQGVCRPFNDGGLAQTAIKQPVSQQNSTRCGLQENSVKVRDKTSQRAADAGLIAALVFVNTLRRLVFKVMEERMVNYPLVLCFITTAAFLPFYAVFFIFKRLFWKKIRRQHGLTKERDARMISENNNVEDVREDQQRTLERTASGGHSVASNAIPSVREEEEDGFCDGSKQHERDKRDESPANTPNLLRNEINAPSSSKHPHPIHYFVLALLDSLQTILYVYGGLYTSGAQQQILPMGAVLFTTSILFCCGRCCSVAKKQVPTEDFRHKVSLCLRSTGFVMIGSALLFALLPPFLSPFGPEALSAMLFLLSGLPGSLSALYRARYMRSARMVELNLGTGFLQLLFLFSLSPIAPLIDLEARVVEEQIPMNLAMGFGCWFLGKDASSGDTCSATRLPPGVDVPGIADLLSGSLSVYLYLILSAVMNLLMFFLQRQPKQRSRRILTLSTAISLPLSVALFSVQPVMGRFTTMILPLEIGATVLSVVGLVFARFGESVRPTATYKKKNRSTRPSFDELFQRAAIQHQTDTLSETEILSETERHPRKYSRSRIHSSVKAK